MTKNTKQRKTNGKSKNNSNQTSVAALERKLNAKLQALSVAKKSEGSWLANAGYHAGNAISKIFGLGSYQLNQNTSWNAAQQVPAMHSTNETVVFRHREYIRDVYTTTAFSVTELEVNPGIDETFPLLAAIAQNFQEYEFRGLVFEYIPTSSVAIASSTNLALGTISMAAQYRADAETFTSKMAVLNEMWSATGRPSDSILLPVECDPRQNAMRTQYIRGGALSANKDIKLYDLCKMSICTEGSQASYVAGEIWVTYEVCLRKPTITGALGLFTETLHGSWGGNYANPLNSVIFYENTLGVTTTATGGIISLIFPHSTVGAFSVLVIATSCVTLAVPSATTTNLALSPRTATFYDGIANAYYSTSVQVSQATTADASISIDMHIDPAEISHGIQISIIRVDPDYFD